jgi:hypothetical protein
VTELGGPEHTNARNGHPGKARFDDGASRCKELSATFDGLGYSKIGSTRNTRLVIRRCMIFSAPSSTELVSEDFADRSQLRLRVTAPSACPIVPIFTSPRCEDRSFSSANRTCSRLRTVSKCQEPLLRIADEQRAAASDRTFAGLLGTMFGCMKAVILSYQRRAGKSRRRSRRARPVEPLAAEIMPAATRWAFGPSEPASRYFPRAQPACTSSIRLLQRPLPTPNAQYQAQRIASAFGGRHLCTQQDQLTAPAMISVSSASSSFVGRDRTIPSVFHVRMAQSSVRLHRGGEVWAA